MPSRPFLRLAIVVVLVCGCGKDGSATPDGGPTSDAAVLDGSTSDASTSDASTSDGGPPDGGEPTESVTDPERSANVGSFASGDEGGSNPNAAFDGILEQTAAESASEPVDYGDDTEVLGREWRCFVRLERVEVHGPSDGPWFETGETGKVILYGYDLEDEDWIMIAEKPVGSESPSSPVIFEAVDLPATAYRGHGVAFVPDGDDGSTTARVAEVVFEGECDGERSSFAWNVSAWLCPANCESASNASTYVRSVFCERDGSSSASEALCPSPKPMTVGGSCNYECPYELVHIGDREFTYDNASGWLHEGSATLRAGPLPSSTAYGDSVGEIAGQPCSILTTNPATYYVAYYCDGAAMDTHCAFQCQDPIAL
jgi:hypothetical protein